MNYPQVNGVERSAGYFLFDRVDMEKRQYGTWQVEKVTPFSRCLCGSDCSRRLADMVYHFRCPWCLTVNRSSARVVCDYSHDYISPFWECDGCLQCGRRVLAILLGADEVARQAVLEARGSEPHKQVYCTSSGGQ